MSETLKMTEAELDAARLNALINGVDLSQLSNDTSEDDDFEIEIIDEEKPKKKTKAKKEKKENKPKRAYEVELLDQFKKLHTVPLNVVFNQHDIPYKEQLWAIPVRTVEYQMELVKSPKVSADIAEKFTGKNQDEIMKARAGMVRYFRLVTYDNVVSSATVLGFVKVTSDSAGNLKYKIKVDDAHLKQNHVNSDKLRKNMDSTMKAIIAGAK